MESYSLKELRNECQKFNIPDKGNKTQLVNRLKKHKVDQLADLSEMSTTNTIVAAKLANPTDDRTALADAKSSLLNSLNSDQFIVHSVRGNMVIGNKRGVMYATANGDRVDQTDEIRTLKIRLVEVEKTIADLQKGSEGFENLRHRFISTYKRDKMQEELLPHEYNWIDDGNIAAHSGNCKYDANLYFRGNRPRKDFKVYNSIYGLPPGVVITAVDDNATIHLLNTHGELSASKFKTLTPKYYALFGNFLKAIVHV